MELSPLMMSFLLLSSFVWGCALGMIHDVNRIIRVFLGIKYSKKEPIIKADSGTKKIFLDVLVFVQDVCFVSGAAIGTVFLCYHFNDGKIRFFALAAVAVGFLLYFLTVGRLVIFVFEPIVSATKILFAFIIRIITVPLFFIIKTLGYGVKKVFLILMKYLAKRRNLRYNKIKQAELIALSEHAFFDIGASDLQNRE